MTATDAVTARPAAADCPRGECRTRTFRARKTEAQEPLTREPGRGAPPCLPLPASTHFSPRWVDGEEGPFAGRHLGGKGQPVDRHILEQLHAQDWDQLGRVLVRYAAWKARIRAWREGARDISLGLGKSAEDIVADVIVKVFAGDRAWDPARGELLPTLKRHVDSELDHLWNRHARKLERPPPEAPEAREAQEGAAAALDPTAEASNPEARIERREEVVAASARVNSLFASVADHPELQAVIDAVLETGDTAPRHLAAHLGVPVSEVNNRLKRLRRRAIT